MPPGTQTFPFMNLPADLRQRALNYLQDDAHRWSARLAHPRHLAPLVPHGNEYELLERFDRRVHAGTANVRDADEFVRRLLGVAPTGTIVASLRRFVAGSGRTPSARSTRVPRAEVHHLRALAAIGVPVHGAAEELGNIEAHDLAGDLGPAGMDRAWDLFWYRWSHENPDVDLMTRVVQALVAMDEPLEDAWPALAAVARRPATIEYLLEVIDMYSVQGAPLDVVRTLIDRLPVPRLDCLLPKAAYSAPVWRSDKIDIGRMMLEAGADPFKSVPPSACGSTVAGNAPVSVARKVFWVPTMSYRTSAYKDRLLTMFVPYGGKTRAKAGILVELVKTIARDRTPGAARPLMRLIKPYLFPDDIRDLLAWSRMSHSPIKNAATGRAFHAVFDPRPEPVPKARPESKKRTRFAAGDPRARFWNGR